VPGTSDKFSLNLVSSSLGLNVLHDKALKLLGVLFKLFFAVVVTVGVAVFSELVDLSINVLWTS